MNKYNIEGGIDFYAELYKSLDIDEDKENQDDDKNKCLITNQLLTEKHVILKCGHKFNYIPLYNDLLNHKQKFNNMEGSNRLHTNQIRCPYCRKKQTELLPYYEELGLKKVNGVNFYDPSIIKTCSNNHFNYHYEKCKYQVISPNFDETKPESETNKKYYTCNIGYATIIQLYNHDNPSQPINYGDENCYCYSHKKLMIKLYKTEEKQKAKELEKAAKQKIKDEVKAAKELEKQKIKEEKQKAKEATKISKKKPVENVVLGPSDVVLEKEGCVQILKTGPNKGKPCGCKISAENLCGRHFKIVHNIIINN
jgi:hypothetical protein